MIDTIGGNDWPRSPILKHETPDWIKRQGFRLVGAWESIQFYNASNQAPADYEPIYDWGHSEDFVLQAKEMGANCVITHFDYTFGFVEQRAQLEKARKFVELCHKHGLKAGLYFRVDSICPQSLVGEERELLSCLQRDSSGAAEGISDYMSNLCYHHPEAMQWLERWLDMAVKEFKGDIIHLDGFIFGGMEGVFACRCDKCRADFKEYLVGKYGSDPALAMRRFGHTQVANLEPPVYPDHMWHRRVGIPKGEIRATLWQEWIAFRCHWNTRLARQILGYIDGLNPEVAVEINACQGVRENEALVYGMDFPSYQNTFDAAWSEDGYNPEIVPSGELVTRIRHCKNIRNQGGTILVYIQGGTERKVRQQLAHNAAFNEGSLGCLGFVPGMPYDFRNFGDTKKAFIKWLDTNAEHYQGVEPYAEAAVWRSQKSLAFGDDTVHPTVMQVEQLLIEDRVPFNIVHDRWLDNPGPERALLIPKAEMMTQAEADAIARYVERGGAVVVGENSSMLDEWRRKREDFLLRPLLGDAVTLERERLDISAQTPAGFLTESVRDKVGPEVKFNHYGKGRVAYVPKIFDKPADYRPMITDHYQYDFSFCDYSGYRLPYRADEFRRALEWCMDGRRLFSIKAERGVVAEYYHQPATGRYLAHLVNLRDSAANGVKIEFARAVKRVRALSPDVGGVGEVTVNKKKGGVDVRLERLDVYALVVIEL